jgi:hypothetical protein
MLQDLRLAHGCLHGCVAIDQPPGRRPVLRKREQHSDGKPREFAECGRGEPAGMPYAEASMSTHWRAVTPGACIRDADERDARPALIGRLGVGVMVGLAPSWQSRRNGLLVRAVGMVRCLVVGRPNYWLLFVHAHSLLKTIFPAES